MKIPVTTKGAYELQYLTRDDRELAGLRPCHCCVFGGKLLPCLALCKLLGQDAFFIENSHESRMRLRMTKLLAYQKNGISIENK